MLGEKLRELRESRGLVQREVATVLSVDTAYISKIESSEKPLSRDSLKKLSEFFDYPENDLITLWLSEKVYKIVCEEDLAIDSLNHTINRIKKERNI